MQIHRVEAFADSEQENPDHDERDQDREGDADLDDERHALGARGGQHETVFERHEADHLAHGVSPRHHHQQAEQNHRQRESQVFARERIGLGGHAQHHHHRKGDEADPEQHGSADADDLFDLAMDAETDDDAVQGNRDHDRLEDERDG